MPFVRGRGGGFPFGGSAGPVGGRRRGSGTADASAGAGAAGTATGRLPSGAPAPGNVTSRTVAGPHQHQRAAGLDLFAAAALRPLQPNVRPTPLRFSLKKMS